MLLVLLFIAVIYMQLQIHYSSLRWLCWLSSRSMNLGYQLMIRAGRLISAGINNK